MNLAFLVISIIGFSIGIMFIIFLIVESIKWFLKANRIVCEIESIVDCKCFSSQNYVLKNSIEYTDMITTKKIKKLEEIIENDHNNYIGSKNYTHSEMRKLADRVIELEKEICLLKK